MSNVVSAAEATNAIVAVTEIKTAKGDLVAKISREYGVAADPQEVVAFEAALLQFSSALVKAD
jgi:hypothetical protein